MDKKYWVPSLEKANDILTLIAENPGKYRLIDISKKTNINKSSIYSLLNTLTQLDWVAKKENETYSLGMKIVSLSSLQLKGNNIVNIFLEESNNFVDKLNETMQISTLSKRDILYLAKKENNSPVRLASDPGMKIPAHATAMGKVLLSNHTFDDLMELYPEIELESRTPYTVKTVKDLYLQITSLDNNNFIIEHEETAEGFCCIASPIKNNADEIIAAISITMPKHNWEAKKEEAKKIINELAKRISLKAAYLT